MTDSKKSLEKRIKNLEKDREKLSESNRRLNERVLELYTLYNLSKALSLSLQLDELFETSMKVIGNALNVHKYNLMLFDDATGTMYMQAIHGFTDDNVRTSVLKPGEGFPGQALQAKKTLLVQKLAGSKKVWVYSPNEKPMRGCYLGIPLIRRDGTAIGVLSAHKGKPNSFSIDDLRLFEAVAENVAIALENARTLQKTKELSHRDELTGLNNRRYFFDRFDREVERGKRYGRMFSLILIDLDHFKNYNDAYGHLSGDRALQEIAKVLRSTLRKVDILARYGGEEFVILLPETDKEGAMLVAEKLRGNVEELGLKFKDQDSLLTLTAGVSSFPLDAKDAFGLIEAADKALYTGKARGRNVVEAANFGSD